ncbi:uncharacterized protein LOC121734469 [Aricia agestis]|uniref:uncharacterized protein LOC121734469 n=1 Tax=Aricia agestis TaxID=91739 RepID=UPI001C206AEC|nr:uncharacterized protein LOC121734469 [Aricia agestis]
MSLLSVTVKKARYVGLQATQFNTYVTLKLQNVKSTTVTVKGPTPCWEQDFLFEINDINLGLLVEVWNKGVIWDRALGYHYLPLTSVAYDTQECGGRWVELEAQLMMRGGAVVGTTGPTGHALLLDCRFEPPFDAEGTGGADLQRKLDLLNGALDAERAEQARRQLQYVAHSGYSEDSDYTSDLNYPVGQHANCSASQFRSAAHQMHTPQRSLEASRENSYEREEYHMHGDTDPLYYNSQPRTNRIETWSQMHAQASVESAISWRTAADWQSGEEQRRPSLERQNTLYDDSIGYGYDPYTTSTHIRDHPHITSQPSYEEYYDSSCYPYPYDWDECGLTPTEYENFLNKRRSSVVQLPQIPPKQLPPSSRYSDYNEMAPYRPRPRRTAASLPATPSSTPKRGRALPVPPGESWARRGRRLPRPPARAPSALPRAHVPYTQDLERTVPDVSSYDSYGYQPHVQDTATDSYQDTNYNTSYDDEGMQPFFDETPHATPPAATAQKTTWGDTQTQDNTGQFSYPPKTEEESFLKSLSSKIQAFTQSKTPVVTTKQEVYQDQSYSKFSLSQTTTVTTKQDVYQDQSYLSYTQSQPAIVTTKQEVYQEQGYFNYTQLETPIVTTKQEVYQDQSYLNFTQSEPPIVTTKQDVYSDQSYLNFTQSDLPVVTTQQDVYQDQNDEQFDTSYIQKQLQQYEQQDQAYNDLQNQYSEQKTDYQSDYSQQYHDDQKSQSYLQDYDQYNTKEDAQKYDTYDFQADQQQEKSYGDDSYLQDRKYSYADQGQQEKYDFQQEESQQQQYDYQHDQNQHKYQDEYGQQQFDQQTYDQQYEQNQLMAGGAKKLGSFFGAAAAAVAAPAMSQPQPTQPTATTAPVTRIMPTVTSTSQFTTASGHPETTSVPDESSIYEPTVTTTAPTLPRTPSLRRQESIQRPSVQRTRTLPEAPDDYTPGELDESAYEDEYQKTEIDQVDRASLDRYRDDDLVHDTILEDVAAEARAAEETASVHMTSSPAKNGSVTRKPSVDSHVSHAPSVLDRKTSQSSFVSQHEDKVSISTTLEEGADKSKVGFKEERQKYHEVPEEQDRLEPRESFDEPATEYQDEEQDERFEDDKFDQEGFNEADEQYQDDSVFNEEQGRADEEPLDFQPEQPKLTPKQRWHRAYNKIVMQLNYTMVRRRKCQAASEADVRRDQNFMNSGSRLRVRRGSSLTDLDKLRCNTGSSGGGSIGDLMNMFSGSANSVGSDTLVARTVPLETVKRSIPPAPTPPPQPMPSPLIHVSRPVGPLTMAQRTLRFSRLLKYQPCFTDVQWVSFP